MYEKLDTTETIELAIISQLLDDVPELDHWTLEDFEDVIAGEVN